MTAPRTDASPESGTAPLPVADATLPALARRLPIPRYERRRLSVGIVHVGVGGFHRAHQAMYLDRLMSAGTALDWAVLGVGVRPADRRMRDVLHSQDGLYTLMVKRPGGGREARVIGSITGMLFAPVERAAVVEALAAPATRIVSLTITEGGYNLDPATGRFDAGDPEMLRDAGLGPRSASVFALLADGLAERRRRGVPPFTVVSCDNIEANGAVARSALVGYATLRDPEVAAWIDATVCFPSSMVDRITPVTAPSDIEGLRSRFGVDDQWPVVCEEFAQWVLEDRFGPGGRPALEQVGVQLVDDVAPYELMKLRLLNASHQALAYVGVLCGLRYVHEAAGHPDIAAFLRSYMETEALPTLRPVPGIDLAKYVSTVIERFANPEIADTLARICADTSDRIPKFVLPVIREQLLRGGSVEFGAIIVASWARYAAGTDEAGRPIDVVDPRRERIAAAARPGQDPRAFLELREIFGDLADDERFVAAYRQALASLQRSGSLATLRAAVNAAR